MVTGAVGTLLRLAGGAAFVLALAFHPSSLADTQLGRIGRAGAAG